MSDKDMFKEMVEELQREIDHEEESTYSAKVLKEYRNPSNVGYMEGHDASAAIKGPCGDTMEIFLRIRDGVVEEASFMTDGCGSSIACGSAITRMATGKTIDDAGKITNLDVLEELDGLPDENVHCAKLAADTLHKALRDRR